VTTKSERCDHRAHDPQPASRWGQARHDRLGDGRGVVDVAGQEVVAAVARHSVERLDLGEGDQVTVFVKATEVMLGKEIDV